MRMTFQSLWQAWKSFLRYSLIFDEDTVSFHTFAVWIINNIQDRSRSNAANIVIVTHFWQSFSINLWNTSQLTLRYLLNWAFSFYFKFVTGHYFNCILLSDMQLPSASNVKWKRCILNSWDHVYMNRTLLWLCSTSAINKTKCFPKHLLMPLVKHLLSWNDTPSQ